MTEPPAASEAIVAGRPQLLRVLNEQSLLEAIRHAGPLARGDLSRLSGLSKPTVGLALANLEQDGLIRVAGRRTGVRGPAAVLFEIRPEAGFVLSLDVGSEFLRGVIADLSGGVRARGNRQVHAASSRARTSGLVSMAEELLAKAGISQGEVTQTIVGSPGVYNPRHDALSLASGLPGWERPGVLAELRRAFGPSTVVENDVNLAAVAEGHAGHGRGVDSFAFISLGTGVGMGLVLGGRLHSGAHRAAGEIGYLPIVGDDEIDVADARRRGSLEAAASAAGVVRAARRLGMKGALSARRVFDAARAGDPHARAVVESEARLVAMAVAAVATVADPALVVLGGGIGRAPGFAQAVDSALSGRLIAPPEVRVSALGDDAVVEGGLVEGRRMAWEKLLDRS